MRLIDRWASFWLCEDSSRAQENDSNLKRLIVTSSTCKYRDRESESYGIHWSEASSILKFSNYRANEVSHFTQNSLSFIYLFIYLFLSVCFEFYFLSFAAEKYTVAL